MLITSQWACAVAPSMLGFIVSVQPSVVVSSCMYSLLHFLFPAHGLNEFVAHSPSARSLMVEYQVRWDGESSETMSDADKNMLGL